MKGNKRRAAVPFTTLALIIVALLILRQAADRPRIGSSPVQANGNSPISFLPTISKSKQTEPTGPLTFKYVEIAGGISGDVKMVGDIDGDTYPDLVIGGMPDEKLNWYRYPNWQKTTIATPGREFTTDGALGDVDGDGDLDIVVPDGSSGDNLVWFENPRPTGDPAQGNQWTRHMIGSVGNWAKDVELADFDKNGRLDVATRNQDTAMIFFQTGANSWTQVSFSGFTTGSEGMASGDIDKDANVDLVLKGVWVRNPGGDSARMASNWTQYTIGAADDDFKALVVDLDKNGQNDVLFSGSEGTADVNWWTPSTSDPTGSWTKNTIVSSLNKAHTLQAADMDLDGDIDVVLGQMHTSSNKEIFVMKNANGAATSWQKQLVGTGGLHNGVVADIGKDGDYDIYGANWTGNPPIKLYENQLDKGVSLDDWNYKEVTSSHIRTFGLAFETVDGDSQLDIVAGRYWYKNPGGDLMGSWTQSQFPSDMHAFAAVNVDDDAFADIIAQKLSPGSDISLYWLEASNSDGTSWNSVSIGSVDEADHLLLGAQGYRIGQVEAGGKPEVIIASGNGIYYFRIPATPGSGNWPRVHVNANPSDEGFALGDFNNDNAPDIAATTGRSKRVEWYRNPGNGSANWSAYHIGDFSEAIFPDRTEIADINDDGKLDIVVAEENDGSSKDAETYWWQQPADPTSTNWTRHPVTTQYTTNSMDTADMDLDGDDDIILAEHRGDLKVAIWENDGRGGLTEHTVDTGKESHLGAQVVDLDGDGDLDIVSIAYDAPQKVHLWRNGPASTSSSQAQTAPEVTEPDQGQTPVAKNPEVSSPSEPVASKILPESGRVNDGLVLLYRFEEGDGTQVNDNSGAGKPLNLTIENKDSVAWNEGGSLTIRGPTTISSDESAGKVIAASRETSEITIEAWIEPQSGEQDGPARIITNSFDPYNRNFTLGQEFGSYDVRLRTTNTSKNGVPSLSTGLDAAESKLTHLVYTRDVAGNAFIYLDGDEASRWLVGGDLSDWDDNYRLALANEFTEDRAWLGTYHLVAIFNRALSPAEVKHNYDAGPDALDSALSPTEATGPDDQPEKQSPDSEPPGSEPLPTEKPSGAKSNIDDQLGSNGSEIAFGDTADEADNVQDEGGLPITAVLIGALVLFAIGIAIGIVLSRSRKE